MCALAPEVQAAPATPSGPASFLNSALAPSAGALNQQIEHERERELNRSQAQPPLDEETTKGSAPSAGPSLTVKAFRFEGNHLYSSSQLSAVIQSYVDRSVQFSDLQEASAQIAQFYRRLGWVVKTQLPPQDIANGVVTIEVIEAKFGRVKLDGPLSQRVKSEKILAILAAAQTSGAPLNSNAIDRALALVGDLAGVSVQGNWAVGEREGETDLIIALSDKDWLTADAQTDNTGSRSTGANRLSANVFLNSPMGWGDLLGLNLLATAGSGYVRGSETVPLGHNGLKLGLNASSLSYHLVSQDFSALNASGVATSFGLELSYPLIKSRPSSVTVALSADHKHYLNDAQGAVASDYLNTPVAITFSGLQSDAFAGGGNSYASLSWSAGRINYDRSPLQFQASDAITTQAAGRYSKTRYALSREQSLFSGLSLYAAVSGQLAKKNLDSSEKFYLGGINGVRAYPSNEAGGSNAQVLNLELRSLWRERVSVSAFVDYGRVMINSDPQFAGAPALNQYALKGAGVTLGFQAPSGASLKATVAQRIGNNPNPSSSGNDQDGSLVKTRIWLHANVPF